MTLPRPGDITVVAKGFPVDLYSELPSDEPTYSIFPCQDELSNVDGFLLVIAANKTWRLVLSSVTMKLGWVDMYDLSPTSISPTVYRMNPRSTIE